LTEKSLSHDGDDAPPHGSVTFCIKDSNFDLSVRRKRAFGESLFEKSSAKTFTADNTALF
jgi:hypothetical protein